MVSFPAWGGQPKHPQVSCGEASGAGAAGVVRRRSLCFRFRSWRGEDAAGTQTAGCHGPVARDRYPHNGCRAHSLSSGAAVAPSFGPGPALRCAISGGGGGGDHPWGAQHPGFPDMGRLKADPAAEPACPVCRDKRKESIRVGKCPADGAGCIPGFILRREAKAGR
ncbi:thiosulfate:glutathione sulfurtransferase isoform X1 [Cavia porcellus]|uniref:thiosulfate:glutathione sulfurtransferase isoform X1 n=1 Tax=Cavia porcellus TaxID=10141 RepID=UPI002FE3C0E7